MFHTERGASGFRSRLAICLRSPTAHEKIARAPSSVLSHCSGCLPNIGKKWCSNREMSSRHARGFAVFRISSHSPRANVSTVSSPDSTLVAACRSAASRASTRARAVASSSVSSERCRSFPSTPVHFPHQYREPLRR